MYKCLYNSARTYKQDEHVYTYIIRNYTNANGIIKRVPRIAYEADGTPSMFESRWAVTHLSQLTVIRKCLENFTWSRCHSIPQRERSHRSKKKLVCVCYIYNACFNTYTWIHIHILLNIWLLNYITEDIYNLFRKSKIKLTFMNDAWLTYGPIYLNYI